MGKAMELRIEEFNNWVTERIAVLETSFESQKAPLDYRLIRREPIHKDFFENCFKSAYIFINEEIEDAKWKAEEANIPEEVLKTAIKAFKELKAKVSKEKAEYRKAFKELQESISQSVEDEANVQKNETLVADAVNAWCGTHKIKGGMKDHFTGGKLQEQIHRITINMKNEGERVERKETRRHVLLSAVDPEDRYFDSGRDTPEEIARKDELERLAAAIGRLQPQQRELLRRIYWNGEKQKDIAAEDGVSERAITGRMKKIYAALKKFMD